MVFAVWGWIVAHRDDDGFLEINPKIVAMVIGMAETEVIEVLQFLQRPDPDSRAKDDDGRRIVKIESYLYHVTNAKKYDEIKRNADKKERNRTAQARFKAKNRESKRRVSAGKRTVSAIGHIDIDIDIDKEKESIKKKTHLDFVLLTQDEYAKLKQTIGLIETETLITELNNYIGSKGKRYKSHYHTILAWHRKRNEDKPPPATSDCELTDKVLELITGESHE